MTVAGAGASKVLRIALLGSFTTLLGLIVFNNLTDYATNFALVSHVLAMDTTLGHSSVAWRAIERSSLQHLAYIVIILWEATSAVVCGIATLKCIRASSTDPTATRDAIETGNTGLAIGLLLWLGGFLVVGGEWFLMWQSSDWNGQHAAFRMFTTTALLMILIQDRRN